MATLFSIRVIWNNMQNNYSKDEVEFTSKCQYRIQVYKIYFFLSLGTLRKNDIH